MQLQSLIDVLEDLAPTRYAEAWDNVGLLAGDRTQAVNRAILTIDYTDAVAVEAREGKCDVVVAYHPPLFSAIKRITADPSTALLHDAIRRGVAIYSPHTALDVADGGTNDMLADAIGLPPTNRRPLRMTPPKASQCKLVTFVPQESLEKVSSALFAAGAGRIGKYSCCSFRSPGTGTFFGEAGTNPTVGQSGRLETAEEVRLETVVPINKIESVISALRESHPYEEPAFDLNQLAAPPEAVGQGRIGAFDAPSPLTEILGRLKRELQIESLLVAGPDNASIKTAAVCAGACGEFLDDAIAQRADLFVTGELRHHDAIKANRAGMTVVCTLHSNSERAVLRRLKSRLEPRCPGLEFLLSQTDRDPFVVR
jgi:dinuclear metal center YbgI/SA1388 family protein